jgi:hypothetical protein
VRRGRGERDTERVCLWASLRDWGICSGPDYKAERYSAREDMKLGVGACAPILYFSLPASCFLAFSFADRKHFVFSLFMPRASKIQGRTQTDPGILLQLRS